jgi:L-lactate dehydrogenase complex protein LldG
VSRESVLAALRRARGSAGPRAASIDSLSSESWWRPSDLRGSFERALADAGGRARWLASRAQLAASIQLHARERAVQRVVDAVTAFPQLAVAGSDSPRALDPTSWADVGLAVLPGVLGVAENGAVFVRERDLPDRALLYLSEHVVLVVAASRLVAGLHDAYDALRFDERGYGAFVCGPSKTADIEQALVVGAHGPRSLEVWWLEGE